jgi:hypothetical protein
MVRRRTMPKQKNNILNDALQDTDTFLDFIRTAAHSKEFGKALQQAGRGPHPSAEMLYEYVLGSLSRDAESAIMDHSLLCPACSEKISELMRFDDGLDASIAALAEVSLAQKLKNLVSGLLLPLDTFLPCAEATRGSLKRGKKLPRRYRIGDKLQFYVVVPDRGYLLIMHYDCAGTVRLVYPDKLAESSAVAKGARIPINGEVSGPPGTHGLKAVWSRRKLFDFKDVDFTDEAQVVPALEKIVKKLSGLQPHAFRHAEYEYKVIRG